MAKLKRNSGLELDVMDRHEKLVTLRCPDSAAKGLAARIQEAKDFTEQFSVPILHFVNGNADFMASGVLLELFEHHFVLTAGHCVKDASAFDSIHVGIATQKHRFDIKFPNLGCMYVTNKAFRDHGYFEIDSKDVGWFKSMQKSFMGTGRLCVELASEFHKARELALLSGFPESIASKTEQGVGSRFLACGVFLPEVAVPEGDDDRTSESVGQSVDILVTDQMLKENRGTWNLEILPQLSGASGGGFWVPEVSEQEDPIRLKLAGIHVGRTPTDQSDFIRVREVLIGHHLRLIADSNEVLRDRIFETWPFLADNAWV